ncbi:hypothetical protein Tco_1113246 [Tanacetum coccineum]|uniref:Uncharacterized protein n=1 Tax=Tanacetum coccineum TaxID=301880 RepID=A0ABQ5IUC9_9ASTR
MNIYDGISYREIEFQVQHPVQQNHDTTIVCGGVNDQTPSDMTNAPIEFAETEPRAQSVYINSRAKKEIISLERSNSMTTQVKEVIQAGILCYV